MNRNSYTNGKIMKQSFNILLPTELANWLISEKNRKQTTLSQIVVKALMDYKEECKDE